MERVKGVPAGADTVEYSFEYEGETVGYVINKPGKKEIWMAFKNLTAISAGSVSPDLLEAGERIWDTCAVEWDKVVRDNHNVFQAVCLDLADTYVSPADIAIKKK